MSKIDYEYEITEERIRAFLMVSEIDRLRWLEELCAFTSLVRQAATTYSAANERGRDGSPHRPQPGKRGPFDLKEPGAKAE